MNLNQLNYILEYFDQLDSNVTKLDTRSLNISFRELNSLLSLFPDQIFIIIIQTFHGLTFQTCNGHFLKQIKNNILIATPILQLTMKRLQ